MWFSGALVVVVVVGVVGIVFARSDRSSASIPPQPGNPATGAPGDHWHEAIGVNICGEWLPNPAQFTTVAGSAVEAGLHTHGDGFIHVEPQTQSDGGNNATLGRWFDNGGWSVSSQSFETWTGPSGDPTKKTWSNGDACPVKTPEAGQRGHVVWSLNCEVRSGNPGDYKVRNGDIIAVGFLVRAQNPGVPPSASSTPSGGTGTPFIAGHKACAGGAASGPTTTSVPRTPGS
jgi:hypothetical protein